MLDIKISEENLELLKTLNRHGVEYLVVGGLAVACYCPQRQVGDLDLIVNRTPQNAKKVRSALIKLGAGNFDHMKLIKPNIQVPFKFFNYDADILTPKKEFDFVSAFSESKKVKINDIHIHIPSVNNLINLISANCKKGHRDIYLLNQLALCLK